jgi:hypothetical protein
MVPVSYFVPGEVTSPKFAYAFAKGCGGMITDEHDYLFEGPVALFASPPVWPLIRRAQAVSRDIYYGDHAYFGRRRFYRITKNAYQHDGTGTATPERFERFGRPVQPWRKTGRTILVCPNTAVYFGLHGLDVDRWLIEVREQIQAVTDRPITIRWKVTGRPIEADLEEAWAVVVFSSAAAIDALIAGVPVVTLAPFAATARMGLTDVAQIERPYYPEDREPFLWNLADHQWTWNEMFAGDAWRVLNREAQVRAA